MNQKYINSTLPGIPQRTQADQSTVQNSERTCGSSDESLGFGSE